MEKILQLGIILLFALMCAQVIGSVLTLKIEFELNTIPTSPSSVSEQPAWHTVETWFFGVIVGTVAYSSPSLLLQRDEEPDDLGMDEDKTERLKHIFEKWQYRIKKRLHLVLLPLLRRDYCAKFIIV